MAYCIKCGKEIPEGAQFCANCGTPVTSNIPLPAGENDRATYTQPVYTSNDESKVTNIKIFTILGIVSLVIAILSLFIQSNIVGLIVGIAALVLAIVSLVKKCRLKLFPIISIVLEVIIIIFVIINPSYLTNDNKEDNTASQIADTTDDTNISYFDLDVGGLTFSIPDTYKYDNTDKVYKRKDNKAILLLEANDETLDSGTFKYRMDELIDSLAQEMFSDYEVTSTTDIKVGGSHTKKYSLNGAFTDSATIDSANAYISLVNNAYSNYFLLIAVISDANCNGEDDFDYIVNSAVNNPNQKDTTNSNSDSKDNEKANSTNSSGVDPDLKAFLDAYEEFIDEYVVFMKKYQEDPSDLSMLGQYTEILEKYSEFAQKIDAYDTKDMSKEDYNYYIDVTTRCSKKLIDVAY